MPLKRFAWLSRVKSVESEFSAARLALDRLLAEAKVNSQILPKEVKVRDVASAAERLEGTYVIRLFAEFETALREFWLTARTTVPPSHDLI